MATAKPEAAAVPAKPMNMGAPTLLAKMDAPTYSEHSQARW